MQDTYRSVSLSRSQVTASRSHSPMRSQSNLLRTVSHSQHGYPHTIPTITSYDNMTKTTLSHDVLQQMPFFDENIDEVVYPRRIINALAPDLSPSRSERSELSPPTPELEVIRHHTSRLPRARSLTPAFKLPFHHQRQPRGNISTSFNFLGSKGATECSPLDEVVLRRLPSPMLPPASSSSALDTEDESPFLLDEDALPMDDLILIPYAGASKTRRSLSLNDAQYSPSGRIHIPRIARASSHGEYTHASRKALTEHSRILARTTLSGTSIRYGKGSDSELQLSTTESSGINDAVENDTFTHAFEELALIDFSSVPLMHSCSALNDSESTEQAPATPQLTSGIATVTSDSAEQLSQELLDLSFEHPETRDARVKADNDRLAFVFAELALIDFSSLPYPPFTTKVDESTAQAVDAPEITEWVETNGSPVPLQGFHGLFELPLDITSRHGPTPAELRFRELLANDSSLLKDLDIADDFLVGYELMPNGAPNLNTPESAETEESLIQWLDEDTFDLAVSDAWDVVLSVITDTGRFKTLIKDLKTPGNTLAQPFINVIQMLIDFPPRNRCTGTEAERDLFMALIRLAKNTFLHPRCLSIKDAQISSQRPIASGYYGDIYKGVLKDIPVCVKMLKYCENMDLDKLSRDYSKEVLLWSRTSHMNVLPFYGTYSLEDGNRRLPCLLSPWLDNGDVTRYLKKNPTVNRTLLVGDIIQGISYLHDQDIVHGDLKAANILVTNSGRACLADFGLSFKGCEVLSLVDSSANGSGTTRWMAPEIFWSSDKNLDDNDLEENQVYGRPTNASDIYAFAGVCYEIYTGKFPFYETLHNPSVTLKIMNGHIPSCPDLSLRGPGSPFLLGLSPEMWQIMVQCWKKRPKDRPSVKSIEEFIVNLGTEDSRPLPDETETALWDVRKNLHRSSEHVSIQDLEGVINWAPTAP